MFQDDFQFIKKVFDFAKRHNMFNDDETILIGLSGGADSVCLLYLLSEAKLNISALYVDHGLRPNQTPSEIDFCSNLCERLNVNFMVEAVDVYKYQSQFNVGIAASARVARYQALTKTAQKIGASIIALGHNKDDQCETFLINMLRGSGMSGLSGIPPVRDNIIRPILCVFRSEIRAFLESRRINYITDPSNLSDKYLRNNIRSSLIPSLIKYNPTVMQTIFNTTEILSQEDRFLETIVSNLMTEIVILNTDGAVELDLQKLSSLDIVILRRLIRRVIDPQSLTLKHVDSIINLIKDLDSGDRVILHQGLVVIKGYDKLTIKKAEDLDNIKIIESKLNISGETIISGSGMIISADFMDISFKTIQKNEVYIDYDKLDGKELRVRGRGRGDYFYPQGFGRRKKLQDFFVDEKIPRDDRDKIPVVVTGDDIVWIAGYRADERFRVTDETVKILKLKIFMDSDES